MSEASDTLPYRVLARKYRPLTDVYRAVHEANVDWLWSAAEEAW